MTAIVARPGTLPREIAPGVFWLSTCLEVPQNGKLVHNHNSCYLVRGSTRSVLIDTGMPYGYREIAAQVAEVLGGRPLDYLFPTHPEAPHMGNAGPFMRAYPDLRLIGDLRNYHLYFPGCEGRLTAMAPGESIDLGDRELRLIAAVIHDLPNSLWAYEPSAAVLFVSDAYPYTHEHDAGQCGMTSEELPRAPDASDTKVVIERALSWTRYVDANHVIRDLDAFCATYPMSIIAPAHGGVITNPAEITEVFKAGLRKVRTAHV